MIVPLLDSAATLLLLGGLAVALFNLVCAPRLHRAPAAAGGTPVSLLVPARDERENLAANLPGLLAQTHSALEILVLDDGSTDGSGEVLKAAAALDPRLQPIAGAPLPPGWLGKNWACHQLASRATGEILLFCDADVAATPEAVARTLGAMTGHGADVLTAIPRQRFQGWAERGVIPLLVHLPVLMSLPLWLVSRVSAPSLSLANGQWLAFRREAYTAAGGHAAVRDRVLEDVELGRRAKAAGLRLMPALATSLLRVRMYRDAREMREGFSKNLYALLGGRPFPFAVGVTLFALLMIWPITGPMIGGSLLPLVLLLAVRACGVLLFRHGWASVALHPAGAPAALGIALLSAWGHRRGTLAWKGRTLPTTRRTTRRTATGRATGVAGPDDPTSLPATTTPPPKHPLHLEES